MNDRRQSTRVNASSWQLRPNTSVFLLWILSHLGSSCEAWTAALIQHPDSMLPYSSLSLSHIPSSRHSQPLRSHNTRLYGKSFSSSSSSSPRDSNISRRGSNSNNRGTSVRSQRQERVGHLVRSELASILLRGDFAAKSATDPTLILLNGRLRSQISIVQVDVSPDLRQARVRVSVRPGFTTEQPAVLDKRRAYSWLVQNSKALKHALAQRMSHMKVCPDLTFVLVDVGAAVDVMNLIDRVASGYKRKDLTLRPEDFAMEEDDDDESIDLDDDDEMEWMEEDNDFFKK
jgi:ribosome-binding factor A